MLITFEFPDGSLVELPATPADGWSFTEWLLGLTGNENPGMVVMNSDIIIEGVFTETPLLMRTLTLDWTGQGEITARIAAPLDAQWYGRNYTESEANKVWSAHPNAGTFLPGDVVLLSGSHIGTWNLQGVNNVKFLTKNFILDGLNATFDRAINMSDCSQVEIHSVDSNLSNCVIQNFRDHHVFVQESNNIVLDGMTVLTHNVPPFGKQTDCFYIQRTTGIKTVNTYCRIYNPSVSEHCDLWQGLQCGDVLIWNMNGRQENTKTDHAQGIFNESDVTNNIPAGTFEVQYCNLYGGKQMLVMRNKDSNLRGVCLIKNNVIEAWIERAIWLNYPSNFNSDIHTANVVSGGSNLIEINQ